MGRAQNPRPKPKGRPKKTPRIRENAGRKPSIVSDSSYWTKRNRALEIVNNPRYDIEVIKIALKLMEKKVLVDIDLSIDESTNDNLKINQLMVKHTRESALALFLEFKLSKEMYIGIRKDINDRGCPIFPSYSDMSKAKHDCLTEDCSVSEVIYIQDQITLL